MLIFHSIKRYENQQNGFRIFYFMTIESSQSVLSIVYVSGKAYNSSVMREAYDIIGISDEICRLEDFYAENT